MNAKLTQEQLLFIKLAETNANTPIVIYHGGCADGFSAAWCFHRRMQEDPDGTQYTFMMGIHNEDAPDMELFRNKQVYFVDFSYKREVIEAMLAVGAIIWIIDHHKTAIEDLAGLDKKWFSFRAYLDMERSGAKLAWDFLHNVEFDDAEEIVRELKAEDKTYTPAPLLLKHVQDRDLWKFLLPKTKELNAALFSYEFTFANWDMLMAYGPEELAYLASQGEALDRKQTKDVKYLIDVCQRMAVIGDSCVPVASIPHLMSSEAGDLMSLAYNNGNDFAATYFDTDKKRVFSLRSQTWGKDVSLTAKHYGGGGHKHAAGFSVPRDHPLAQI